jgi:hypothetical protein
MRSAHVKSYAPPPRRVMNIRVPLRIWDAVDQLSKQHGALKNDAIVALLEAGLRVGKKKIS